MSYDNYTNSNHGTGPQNMFQGYGYQNNNYNSYQYYWPGIPNGNLEAWRKAIISRNPEHDKNRIRNAKDPMVEGCYEWIFDDENYLKWKDSDTCDMLHLTGDPGKGKTMLMIALTERISKSLPSGSALTFFFCQNTDSELRTANAVLRGLIWKLADEYPPLAKHILHEYKRSQKQFSDNPNLFELLQSILSNMLKDSTLDTVYLLIDALDELETFEDDKKPLLEFIQREVTSPESKGRWFFSSRHHLEIKEPLRLHEHHLLELELNASLIDKAVRTFIDYKVKSLSQRKCYSEDLQKRLKEKLVQKANATFLWVALVCKVLEQVGVHDPLEKVRELPSDLEALYDRMMDYIVDSKGATDTVSIKRLMRVVVLAYRPLSWRELVTTADLSKHHAENKKRFNDLVEQCGSFIVLRDGVAYFVHQSAKDYLVSEKGRKIFDSEMAQEHGDIVHRLSSSMSKVLKKDICALKKPGASTTCIEIDKTLEGFEYACSFWVNHLADYLGTDFYRSQKYQKVFSHDGFITMFLRYQLLHWFEALSLIKMPLETMRSMDKLKRLIDPQESRDLYALVCDAHRFALQVRSVIEETPLQLYCSALIFAPEKSVVRSHFQNQIPSWVVRLPKVNDDWECLRQTLEGHKQTVTAVAISPNGHLIASASNDSTVKIWAVVTGDLEQVLEHEGKVNALAFSPKGSPLASSSSDGWVRLWKIKSDEKATENRSPWKRVPHEDNNGAVLFSPDGQYMASKSKNIVMLWEVKIGKLWQTLTHEQNVTSIAFSTDNKLIASASDDQTVRIWDVQVKTGRFLHQLNHEDVVNAVAFSPNSHFVVSGSGDHIVRLWTSKGELKQRFKGHKACVTAVAFSPDGKIVGSVSDDDTIRLWAIDGTLLSQLDRLGHKIRTMVFSPDSKLIASASMDKRVRLWSTTEALYHLLIGHTGEVTALAFSPDNQILVSASADTSIKLWMIQELRQQKRESSITEINTMAISPDGRLVASTSIEDNTISIQEMKTGKLRHNLEGHWNQITTVAFSPDLQYVASGAWDATVRLYDLATGTQQYCWEDHERSVETLCFSPDCQLIVSGSDDTTLTLWKVDGGTKVQIFKGHLGRIHAVAFSSDNRLIASASSDSTVRLWDVSTHVPQQVFRGHTGPVNSVVFSADSQLLVSGSEDRTVRLWEASTGRQLRILGEHSDLVNIIALSQDNRLVASGSSDGTVRLWDVGSGKLQQTIQVSGVRKHLTFSRDDQYLDTDRGRLVLSPLQSTSIRSLYVEDGWVMRGRSSEKILWLPDRYRPMFMFVSGDNFVLGPPYGQAIFMELSGSCDSIE